MKSVVTHSNSIRKISLFDILISDIHAGDDYTTIEGTIGLTYHEVWEWISSGGDWGFKVTEHNCPDNVFMIGTTTKSMNDARKGEETLYLGEASPEELDELADFLRNSVFKN